MIADGQIAFEGGVDSGRSPSLIENNQLSWAVNVTCRGGFLTHRPGIKRKNITFGDSSSETLFATGLFQGSSVYQGAACRMQLMAAISGHIITIDLGTNFTASDISTGDPLINNSFNPKTYFCQAERFMVIQDTLDVPLLYDGASLRRSVVDNQEVPTGGPMAYGKGRLWVARGKSYVGGDLVYSDGSPDAVIRFTENTFLNEGGRFYVPSEHGDCSDITALAFGSNLDTTLSDGDLMVFTKGSIFAFSAPIDRDVWKNLNYPIQRFAMIGMGSMNQDGVTTVNGDLFFRSQDGIRSYIFARRDFSQSWSNTPVSDEVIRALKYDNENLLYAGSSVWFDDRLLTTIGPYQHARGVAHRGLAALDFNLVSSMRVKAPPAWEGVWTGVKILQVHRFRLNGILVCYAFGIDDTGSIGLWEITTSEKFDSGIVPIEWIAETRAFNYETPFLKKQAMHKETWVQDVVGECSITSRYRSDSRQCWESWGVSEFCNKEGVCDQDEDYCGVKAFQPGVKNRLTTVKASNVVRAGEPTAIGYEHQARMECKGSFVVRRFRVTAEPVIEGIVGKVGTQ